MNCQNARHLLEYARPQGFDLDAADQAALEQHLATCPECDSLLRATRQFDEQLGKAIRAVPEPKGLAERLRGRLRQERDEWLRQWMGRATRYTAAAAAVLLLLFGGFNLWSTHKPKPSAEDAITVVEALGVNPPQESDARQFFQKKGEPILMPPGFMPVFLRSYNLTQLEGKPVPHLHYVRAEKRDDGLSIPRAEAEVYILSRQQFDLKDVPLGETERSGDLVRVRVERPPGDFVYVIRYTGSLNDLRQP